MATECTSTHAVQDECTSQCSSSPRYFIHNPYALPPTDSDIDTDSSNTSDYGEEHRGSSSDAGYDDLASCDTPNSYCDGGWGYTPYCGGSMILLNGIDGTEFVLSRAEVIERTRRQNGRIDRELASPCGHMGRFRRRTKNGITHCRCTTCGAVWREIAYHRIRPDQLDGYHRSVALANCSLLSMHINDVACS